MLRARENNKQMTTHYFLNPDHTYRECSLDEWEEQFKNQELCRVAAVKFDDYFILTIWLGLHHNFLCNDPPLVFETIVFKPRYNRIYQDRYSTWDQALAGHQKAIEWVKRGCKYDE